jgi:hypothetical protein
MPEMAAPKMPSAAEVRRQIAEAENAVLQEVVRLGEALVIRAVTPDRSVDAEEAELAVARARVEQLKAMLPIVEKIETDAVVAARAKLAEEQRRRLERELRDLAKAAMQFSVYQQNAASAFRRLVKAGTEATGVLNAAQKQIGNGHFVGQLHAASLKRMCETEINRLGLRPSLDAEGISAPGTNRATVGLGHANSPHLLPALEPSVKAVVSAILANSLEPLQGPQESENGEDLSQVAGRPERSPAAPSAARSLIATEETV